MKALPEALQTIMAYLILLTKVKPDICATLDYGYF